MLGQPRDTDGLPARFIMFWAAIGASGHAPRTARRLAVINILSLMVALMTIPYIVLYGVHDWRGLWIPIVTLSPQVALYAITPLWNRAGPYASAIYLSLVWVVFALLYTWYFGRESGLHYYFLPGAAASMLVCGADKLRYSALIAFTSLAGFVVAERVFIGPAPFIVVSPGFTDMMFALSAPFAFLLVFATVLYAFLEAGRAEDALEREHQRSEALLFGILPRRVAERLKAAPDRAVAEALPAATILIADVVSFSAQSAGLPPAGVLEFLDTLFGRFDRLTAAHRFETIKTIGDAYMA
ncbi:MAG: adenylate/guanylate cyclase domain-containing protein, partial [Rhizobiaceae bacterium]